MSRSKINSKISDKVILKIGLIGYGKLGKLIETYALEQGHSVLCKLRHDPWSHLENADVVIDVSHQDGILERIDQILSLKKPLVIGTTGWEEHLETAQKKVLNANGCALYTPNFSPGVYFFTKIVESAAKLHAHFSECGVNYDVAGLEIHHKEKKDAPSGTAKKLAKSFPNPCSFTSLRVGNFSGTHTLVFDSFCDTITLTHDARSRQGFAQGAVKIAEWIIGKTGWLTLEDMFGTLHSTHHSF